MSSQSGNRIKGIIMSEETERRLANMAARKANQVRINESEMPFKEQLEGAGRLSYFQEVFENIPLEAQIIEVPGFPDPKNAEFFKVGRQIAAKLVRNNIANLENYGKYSQVEAKHPRKGR